MKALEIGNRASLRPMTLLVAIALAMGAFAAGASSGAAALARVPRRDLGSHPIAAVQVRKAGPMAGMLAIDVTDSDAGPGRRFERMTVSIFEEESETKVREETVFDDFENTVLHVLTADTRSAPASTASAVAVAALAGVYRVELEARTTDGAVARDSDTVAFSRDVVLSPGPLLASALQSASASSDSGACTSDDVSCTTDETDGYTACTVSYEQDCYIVDLNDVLAVAQATDPDAGFSTSTTVAIGAFGAAGGDGCDYDAENGGNGGKGGYAQVFTTIDDFPTYGGTTDVYFYLGEKGKCKGYQLWPLRYPSGGDGGASTIVSWKDTGSDSDGYYQESDLLIVAGGGGGGSAPGSADFYSYTGGHGNYYLYEAESAYTTGDGRHGKCDNNSDATAYAGGVGGSAFGGMGGDGGKGSRGWLNGTPPVGSNGAGGDAYYSKAYDAGNPGAGGGGAGGGDAGDVCSNDEASGAGGASLVAPSTVTDVEFDPSDRESNDSDGAIYFYFFDPAS